MQELKIIHFWWLCGNTLRRWLLPYQILRVIEDLLFSRHGEPIVLAYKISEKRKNRTIEGLFSYQLDDTSSEFVNSKAKMMIIYFCSIDNLEKFKKGVVSSVGVPTTHHVAVPRRTVVWALCRRSSRPGMHLDIFSYQLRRLDVSVSNIRHGL